MNEFPSHGPAGCTDRSTAAGLVASRHRGPALAPLRAAVVGAGHLGRFHARKYQALPDAELVAIVDTDPRRAEELADEHSVAASTQHLALCGRVDVASVVTPTAAHYPVTRDLLDAGIDVLLEKPMASSIREAYALTALARRRGCVLQIGHLERFNPVTEALAARISAPRFIEAQRVATFQLRGTDVDVVLDLMIHDIDLVLNLVGQPVRDVRADGIPVLSERIDIAHARLEFEGGCVANLTASRVSSKRERRMRLFQADAYFAVDFDQRTLEIRRRDVHASFQGVPGLGCERLTVERADPLHSEIAAFLKAVRDRAAPVVPAIDGCRALATALEISRQVDARMHDGRAGPWGHGPRMH